MRVLLLTDNFLPHRGGSRIYYHELFSRLAKRDDCEVHILTRAQEGDAAFDAKQPYAVTRCPLEESEFLEKYDLQHAPIYRNLWKFGRQLVRDFQPHVIVAGELVPTGPVVRWLASRAKLPYIIFTHAEGPATIARTRFQSRLARWACRRAGRIVAASDNAQLSLVVDLGADPERISVIVPGVGEGHFDPQYQANPCDAPFTKDHPARILTVGRLIERKGHIQVLRAMPELIQQIPDIHYNIIGTGYTEGLIRQKIKDLGLQDYVDLRGGVSDEELFRAYAESDLFVLPNHDNRETGDTEGFVIALGEASAHGLPVIGGRAGGTMHSVRDGETGLLVDGSNPGAISDAVLDLLSQPEKAREMGLRGQTFAREKMQWNTRAEEFYDILERQTAI
ncbi:MAG: glycosyltransferase family 4 protein [Candidatus Sumerlaeia bacterium]